MELVVGLALEQAAAVAGAQHLGEPFLPCCRPAAAAGSAAPWPRSARCPRRYLVQADAEVGVLEPGRQLDGALERLLDPLAVARRGDAFLAQHSPLHPRRIRASQIEPRLGIIGRPLGPALGRADGPIDGGAELVVQRAVERIGEDAPPQRGGREDVAGFGRRRAAGAAELGVDKVEAGVEDEVVGAGERRPRRGGGRTIGRRRRRRAPAAAGRRPRSPLFRVGPTRQRRPRSRRRLPSPLPPATTDAAGRIM